MASITAVAMPTAATTHIHKIAPGPPTVSAIATPAMFPGTHPRRKAYAECLKRRDPTVLAMGPPELAKRPPEVADLNESGAHREIDANTNEQINEDLCVQDIAKRINQLLLKEVQICSLSTTGRRPFAEMVGAKC